MTDRASSSPPESGPEGLRQPGEKRPRTAYLLQRRYRMLSHLAAAIGGAIGVGLVAYSLGPAIAAGARVPTASFVVGAVIIGALALVPYLLVRWRWRLVKASLDDD